jgi:hypothetical protein
MRGILQLRPWIVLTLALALTAAIAITDWRVAFVATLGFLYIFPLALLRAWSIETGVAPQSPSSQ